LKYDGISTNDAQLWMPQNKAYRMFAKDVANNGYVNDTSCTALCVDLDGTMRYKDVNNLPTATKQIIAYQYKQGYTTAIEVAISASSGFNNAVSGYQNMRVAQSTTGTSQSTITDLSFTFDSKAPLYNQPLKTELKRGPVRFGPIDVGNVHDNYERASYQNTRYRNLFSMGLDLMLPVISDIQLLDQVNFSVQREDAEQDVSNSSAYTVTGHSIYIQGASYFEKLNIVRHGTNSTYVGG